MNRKNKIYAWKVEISRNRDRFRLQQTSIPIRFRLQIQKFTRVPAGGAMTTPGRHPGSPEHLGRVLLDSVVARTPWTTPPLRILGFRRYFQPDYSRSRLHPSVFVYTICQKPHEVYPSSVKPPVHNYDIKTLVQGP